MAKYISIKVTSYQNFVIKVPTYILRLEIASFEYIKDFAWKLFKTMRVSRVIYPQT